MRMFDELSRALLDAGSMTWQITWSLILGFILSAVIQAVGQGAHRIHGGPHRHGNEHPIYGRGFWRRLISRDGYTSVTTIFVMGWAAVIREIIIGLLIARAVAAWVPGSFWRQLFLIGHPLAAQL